jgi:hypothetical protein
VLNSTQANLGVNILFAGRFNTPLLATEYAKLPGVQSSWPLGGSTDVPDVCVSIEGEIFYYIFDEASGDCPAGCINYIYHDYSTDSTGIITPSSAVSSQQRAACGKWL